MVENEYAVSKRQWKKWDEQERYLFNSIYTQMMSRPDLFMHPETMKLLHHPLMTWETTAWNAAWIAADDLRWFRKNS